jgi:hypothetical protein
MPLTTFPALNLSTPNIDYDPIKSAIGLEQLSALRRENRNQDALNRAADQSYVTKQEQTSTDNFGTGNPNSQGPGGVDTTVNFDPDLYSKTLNSISPEAGQKFDSNRMAVDKMKQELEEGALKLGLEKYQQPLKMDIVRHEAIGRTMDYGDATGWKDQKGAMAIFNKYMDSPEDKAVAFTPIKGGVLVTHADGTSVPLNKDMVMQLGRSKDVQLQQYNEMNKWYSEFAQKVSQQELTNADPIRKEYLNDPNTKIYQTRGDAYVSILESNKSGEQAQKEHPNLPGARSQQDLGMVYGYIKLLDAMTGVRESEIGAVTNIPGILNWAKNIYASLESGGALTETQRREILRNSEALYKGSKNIHDKATGPRYDSYAKAAGVRVGLVRAPLSFESVIEGLKPSSKTTGKKDSGVEYGGYTFPNQDALNKYKKDAGITD